MNKKILKRMLELSDIKPLIKEEKMNLSNFELVKNSVNGKTYAIVRENNRYYIKDADTKNNLTESDFDYIGGLANKAKKSFYSYEESTKHLNLMFEEINNHYDVSNVNLLESDVLNEKKFVLKLNKPKSKPKTDSVDFGGETPKKKNPEEGDNFDFGGDSEEGSEEGDNFDFGGDSEEGSEEGDNFDFGDNSEEGSEEGDNFDFGDDSEEGDDSDFGVDETSDEDDEDLNLDDSDDEIKDIQSTTGKLGQQLRDIEDISSDMQKWVAKSILSALDLDNMDSEDKKDIIRAVKKKSKQEPEEESDDESFDFDAEKEIEENYDSYMDDETCTHCNGMGIDEFTGEECEWCGEEDNSTDPNLLKRKDVDSALNYVSYMNDDSHYMSYMKEKKESYSDTELNNWLNDMEMAGFGTKSMDGNYDNFMEDVQDDPYTPHDESKLLFDNSNNSTASMKNKMDLPYLNRMETFEQATSYREVSKMANNYGFSVGWCHKDKSEDPEESTIYLDVKDGKEKLMKVRINSMGNIEMGTMRGMHFIGEPIDSLNDFDEALEEDGKLNNMGPQREKSPEKPGRETETKPGRPEKTPDKDRPSRRPFNPPPHITPGEEPGPKARFRRMNNLDPTMAPSPAPSKPSPKEEPGTKPGRPEKTPDKDRPSRRPFNPPPHITPGEEPGPKARGTKRGGMGESDVEFS